MGAIRAMLASWSSASPPSTYIAAKAESAEFVDYKKNTKRAWVGQKADLAGLLGNIVTKLKTYDMKPYTPKEGYRLSVGIRRER